MTLIERWWRVTPRNPEHRTVWVQEDPSDRLYAAWEGATVTGPFVPEQPQGAVAADEIKLASVEHEYERYEVKLSWPDDEPGLSAGTWSSNLPTPTYGMVVYARRPELLRQTAAALIEAAEVIEHGQANPIDPPEDLYRETAGASPRTDQTGDGDGR